MYSEKTKDKILSIIAELRVERAKNFTQKEIANFLEVSEGTIKNFESGRLLDVSLIEQYTAILTNKLFILDII